MGFTVSVDHPHFPEGTEFGVGNLGSIPNGSSKEIDEDDERLFVMARGLPLDKAFENDPIVSIKGSSALDKSEVDSIVEQMNPPEENIDIAEPQAADEENVAAATLGTPDTATSRFTAKNRGDE